MNLNCFICFSLLVLSLLFGCTSPAAPTGAGTKKNLQYFDLKGFMLAEKERLAQVAGCSKTVLANGKSETKTLEKVNLENELKPFLESDINKPAWVGKYEIDSIFNENQQLTGLRYLAKDNKLKTKVVNVQFDNGEVIHIFIENATHTNVANTYQALTYLPKSGYSIESKQSVSLMDEHFFKVEVEFPGGG